MRRNRTVAVQACLPWIFVQKKKINKKISKTRVLFKVRITYKDELLGTRPFCRPFGPPFVREGENIAPVDAAGPC